MASGKILIRSAFTLIELLVVIAIISILATILLPSLKRAQEMARNAGCISAIRSIGVAAGMYATDNQSHTVPANEQTTIVPPECESLWFGKLRKHYMDEAAPRAFNCPMATHLKDKARTSYWPGFHPSAVSYGWNDLWLTYGSPWGTVYTQSMRTTDVGHPSQTVEMADTDDVHPTKQISQFSMYVRCAGTDIGYSGATHLYPPVFRHLGKSNVCMVDGHAESLTYDDLETWELFNLD